MEKILGYFSRHSADYLIAVGEHLQISFISVAFACLAGIPLGILCSRRRRVRFWITGIFATLRVIPSLAVLLLCIPLMGTGIKPAVTALTFLAMPPILINTALAFGSIPGPVLETAFGMGMSRRRTFFFIKVPLSLPLVLAGFKTAVVEVIASATLAAYIGAGGLGTIIFTGLGLLRSEFLLIGGISVAFMSILADFLLSRLERRLLRYRHLGT
jgi:osmoprotectant transport system permease protein